MIPKVQSQKDIHFVSKMIDLVAHEQNRANIRLIACIESALGIMNLREWVFSSFFSFSYRYKNDILTEKSMMTESVPPMRVSMLSFSLRKIIAPIQV